MMIDAPIGVIERFGLVSSCFDAHCGCGSIDPIEAFL